MKNIFFELAEVEAKIKELGGVRDQLRLKALKKMDRDKLEQAPTEFGTFYTIVRKTWTYSKKYQETEDAYEALLKGARLSEQENGNAKMVETKTLGFRAKTEKGDVLPTVREKSKSHP